MTKYRIDYTIQSADDDSDDYREIGFGGSGAWDSLDAALYEVSSAIQNYEWETSSASDEETP